MSRIGKLPVIIPEGVEVKIQGSLVEVAGSKGKLSLRLPKGVAIEREAEKLLIKPPSSAHLNLWGLSRTLVANLIAGVTEGFSKRLEIHGVGYKALVDGSKLTLHLGYSHPIEYQLPEGIESKVEANIITISGTDKQQVGQVAAEIRNHRPPEPYKGKGIRYEGEQVRRKAGKAAAAKTAGAS